MTETAPPTTPEELLEVFHSRRELAVTQPKGNLALVNTQWVDVEQTIYGVPGTWAPLPAGRSGLALTASAEDGILLDGVPVEGTVEVRGKDSDDPGELTFGPTVSGFVIAGEDGRYALRVWDAESEAIRAFGSIDRFPYNHDWVITARFRPNEGGAVVGFEHVKDEGRTRDLPIPGGILFEKDGVAYDLAAFKSGKALQLVFADATTGESSYGVGRFLFVAPNADGSITLDFNRAVLPPCAFSYSFNCPMPPRQNRFAVPIEAGEKNVLAKDGTLLHG
ncbi:MAG: DUF1684 domain-containing protein [Microbacteriaceae bacterium]